MPADFIYAVDFANGNLTPFVDKRSWGDMHPGRSAEPVPGGARHIVTSQHDSKGRILRIAREDGSPGFISNSVYVSPSSPLEPPPNSVDAPASSAYVAAAGVLRGGLPLATRFILRVEFDSPHASSFSVPQQPGGGEIDPVLKPEPWAVVLKLKQSNSPNDAPADVDPGVAVTCQFNNENNPNGNEGARLNTPGAQQGGRSEPLDAPLDYPKWGSLDTLFVLEHAFCGIQAGPAPVPPATTPNAIGHSAGCGFLEIRPNGKEDLRVFSSTGLSKVANTSIGALGVALVTLTGVGEILVRLRRFSVAIN